MLHAVSFGLQSLKGGCSCRAWMRTAPILRLDPLRAGDGLPELALQNVRITFNMAEMTQSRLSWNENTAESHCGKTVGENAG